MSGSKYKRRDFLKSMALGFTGLAVPGCAGFFRDGPESGEKPNIILIMADDLGYGDLGCYGNRNLRTPRLDALAEGGVRFLDFHSNGAVCSPTRAALLTGRYQQRCGVEGVVTAKSHRHTGMDLGEATFAEVLKSSGYATGLFGKWHLGYPKEFNPRLQGFDAFRGFVSGNVDYHSHIDQEGYADWWRDTMPVPEEGYATDLITDHGVRFIEENRDRPFCLYLPHGAPHYPYQGRKDEAVRSEGNPKPIQGGRKDKKAAYGEMIETLDEGVGRITDTIERLGLEGRTFIFFCSDNGPAKHGSSGPLRGGKGSLWEGGHRVPAIARRPGRIPDGIVSRATIMGMDLFPTLAAMAGAQLPDGLKLDGIDITPHLERGRELPERTLFWRHGRSRAVRNGPWKLLVKPKGERLLFNLDEDLGEENDLANRMPEKVKELREALEAWEADVSRGVTKIS